MRCRRSSVVAEPSRNQRVYGLSRTMGWARKSRSRSRSSEAAPGAQPGCGSGVAAPGRRRFRDPAGIASTRPPPQGGPRQDSRTHRKQHQKQHLILLQFNCQHNIPIHTAFAVGSADAWPRTPRAYRIHASFWVTEPVAVSSRTRYTPALTGAPARSRPFQVIDPSWAVTAPSRMRATTRPAKS